MNGVRLGLLVIVSAFGFAGLYGSVSDCTDDAHCPDLSTVIPPAEPAAPTPIPVVSINNSGVGLAAYPAGPDISTGRDIVVRRFEATAGFSDPVTVASGFREDLDAVMAGDEARIAWRGPLGRISVLGGDVQTGMWNAPVDLAAGDAGDPVFASGRSSSPSRGFIAWRQAGVGPDGPIVQGYGSLPLRAPHELLTGYGPGAGVSERELFHLRVATGGLRTIAVWTAGQVSDSSIVHAYVAFGSAGSFRDATARRLARVDDFVAPAVDMDDDGNVVILWADSEGLYYSRNTAEGWSEPRILHRPENPVRDVEVDVSWNGSIIAAWRVADGSLWAAAGTLTTDVWTAPHRLDPDSSASINNNLRVAIDQVGRAIVVWRNPTGVYANVLDAGAWTPPELLGPAQSPPDLDMNDRGLGVAVWWNEGLQSRTWPAPNSLRANFTFSPDPGVEGLTIEFDARTSGGPAPVTDHVWVFDNATSDATGPLATPNFDTVGEHTAQLTVTDSSGQTDTITRTVNVVAIGTIERQVIVNYEGQGDGQIEIRSAQPGFTPVLCAANNTPGQPGTCTANLLVGYDTTIVADSDAALSTFSGWPLGVRRCRNVSTSTSSGRRRDECHFLANNYDRTFDVGFETTGSIPTPPTTQSLHVTLARFSLGGGHFYSRPSTLVDCIAENQRIVKRNDPNALCEYASIPQGTTLTVVAVPAANNTFIEWLGCDTPPPPQSRTECVVTMDRPRTITAQFSGG